MCLEEIRLVILGPLQCLMRSWMRDVGLFCSNVFGTQVAASSTVDKVGLQDSTVVLDERRCAFRQHGVLFVQRRRCCSLRWG